MPRKIYDPRLLTLTLQATTDVKAAMSMELAPDHLVASTVPTSPGYPWGWADVTVSATWAGYTEEHQLKGVSFPSQTEFMHSAQYQDALVECLTRLLHRLDKAASAVKALGPKAAV